MKISGRDVGDGHPVFVVAEIGQNHQGSLEVAKRMIVKAKELGADCVKFQKSCIAAKFTRNALRKPYSGDNSWGSTYGEHKAFLEFSLEDYKELQRFCAEQDILFSASAMDPVSLQQLLELRVPFIKIGSGDADNVPMLRTAAAATSVPLIVSTGMQSWSQVQNIYPIIKAHPSAALLHCISAYPTPPEQSLLNLVPLYKDQFPELVIGYSGHEMGLQLSVASVLAGARIVERHFTLDKSWKGTDHRASLDPAEFGRLVRYVRAVEGMKVEGERIVEVLSSVLEARDFNGEELALALRSVTGEDRKLLVSEVACHKKLGKSLVFAGDFAKGHKLREEDVAVKVSDPHGLSPTWYDQVVGRTVARDCRQDEPICGEDIAGCFG
ncbi:sialic acid synthase [Culex quinquefasciatus]|uniref:sialic acid synthase n=1 Tax=Culex quinquefasciatus TaxID=7176 RepID=UPI0018E3D464|nr:sialic acid synthase [Culex quinquefasciatus]